MVSTAFGLLLSTAGVMPSIVAGVEFGEKIVSDGSVHRAQMVCTLWFPMGLKMLCSKA